MTPSELMLGDWVQFRDMNWTVTAILKGTVVVEGTENEWYADSSELNPIPLTAEILEKNGFGYVEQDEKITHYYLGDKWYLDNPDLHIGTYNNGVYWLNNLDNAMHRIKYVHELQHALKLCKIEKEIEL